MKRDEPEIQANGPKFRAFELVRIRKASEFRTAEVACPGDPTPPGLAMGRTGPVVMEGRNYVFHPVDGPTLTQTYSVFIDGIGNVLASEDWLEDGEPHT